MNLPQLVAAYDAGEEIQVPQMFQDSSKEHHGQCLSMEVCRELMSVGLTLDGWNAMEDEWSWLTIIVAAWERARLNTSASHENFTIADALTAASYAGNYFEHGYDNILGQASPHLMFTGTGGVVIP